MSTIVGPDADQAVACHILETDLKAWRERRLTLRIQYKVREAIGWPAESLAPFLTELEQVEQAIELEEAELAALAIKSPPSVSPQ